MARFQSFRNIIAVAATIVAGAVTPVAAQGTSSAVEKTSCAISYLLIGAASRNQPVDPTQGSKAEASFRTYNERLVSVLIDWGTKLLDSGLKEAEKEKIPMNTLIMDALNDAQYFSPLWSSTANQENNKMLNVGFTMKCTPLLHSTGIIATPTSE